MDNQPVWNHLQSLLDRGADPNQPEPYRQRLHAALQPLDARGVAQLQRGIHDLRVRLRSRPLWCAASLVLGRHASDTEFTDLRGWLIAHGQARVERALQEPDSLVELRVPLDRQGQPVPFLKPVNATPGKVYLRKVSDDDALDARIRAEFESEGRPDDGDDDSHLGWLYWELPEATELATTLPALWSVYGQRWTAAAAAGALADPFPGMVREAVVRCLGRVRLGDVLIPRGEAAPITVLGITDLNALMAAEGEAVDDDDDPDADLAQHELSIRFVARVQDADGLVHCNQGLSHLLQRWPHEADDDAEALIESDLEVDGTDDADGGTEPDADDDDGLDAWEARDQLIQDRVAAAIGGEVRVIYAASEDDADELPIDNLDDLAFRGSIRFVETDPLDGERFESEVLENPTWLDLARVANIMMITLGYEDHVYLEGFEVVRRPRGKPRIAEFLLGS